jgi:methylated-DNA-[protein]-cysteine S-methyltransferase
MKSYTILKTAALGELLLVADGEHLTGIYFAHNEHAPAIPSEWRRDPEHPVLREAAMQIEDYLAGRRETFTLPLRLDGTAFQKAVWREIAGIPFGETISYAELAVRAGNPAAIRAAGTATGRNPISIVVPCHRIVGKNGGLGGYAGTLERKKHLLGLERSIPRK